MKHFLAVFTGSETSVAQQQWSRLAESERKRRQEQGMQAWQAWVIAHREAIVEHGAPLGRTKQVSTAGIADTRNNLAAYVVVQAESHEAAARLFENHPHFMIFPGESVEVMECLPVPGG